MTGSGKLCFKGQARPQTETLRVQCTKANAAGLNAQGGAPGRGHFARFGQSRNDTVFRHFLAKY
jgi:hypothetical protein